MFRYVKNVTNSMSFLWILFFFTFNFYMLNVEAQSTSSTSNDAHCFEFTWLGPTYSNESIVNGTCDSFDEKPPICINPLVYTADGSKPNTTAMWADQSIRERVNCRLASNEVCAKWTYFYNDEVENSTHLCTKITIDGRTPMRSGCERQFKDGYTIEVCACVSAKGPMASVIPCNKSSHLQMSSIFTMLLFILISSSVF